MPRIMASLAHAKWFIAGITGALGAASADIHCWLKFQKWSDFKSFDFGTASFRWAIGFVTGALAGSGYGALIS